MLFSWRKVLYHFAEAEKSVQSKEAQSTEVGQPSLHFALGAGWGRMEGREDRFKVELAEWEKRLGFLFYCAPFIHLGPIETYALQRGLLVAFKVTII